MFVLMVSGFVLYQSNINSKYNDPEFKSYVKKRQYCGSFWGGDSASKEEMYKDWQNHTAEGC